MWIEDCLNHCFVRANCHLWKPRISTFRTSNLGSIAPRAIWYMDHIYIHVHVDIFVIGQSSCNCQTASTTALLGLIVIYGTLGYLLYAHSILGLKLQGLFGTWTTHLSICVLNYSKGGKVHVTVRLPKPLRREGWLSFYKSIGCVLFAHLILNL